MKSIFILLGLCFSLTVSAGPVNKLVVFGDSLSDNGNLYEYMKHQLPVSPPYYQGRFTNGPVWVEHLAAYYFPNDPQAHLLDYAFGGSGVRVEDEDDDDDDEALLSLDREVDSYLLAHHDKADDESLYIIWMGANNYLAIPDEVEGTVLRVNEGIRASALRLVEKGAKHIMLVNLPDLGKTPAAVDFESVDLFSTLSAQHNAMLDQNIVALKEDYPDVQWLLLDVNDMFARAINFPQTYGFTNVTDTCYEAATLSSSSQSVLKLVASVQAQQGHDACQGYLFFDPVHPSGPAHETLAREAIALIDKSGLEFATN